MKKPANPSARRKLDLVEGSRKKGKTTVSAKLSKACEAWDDCSTVLTSPSQSLVGSSPNPFDKPTNNTPSQMIVSETMQGTMGGDTQGGKGDEVCNVRDESKVVKDDDKKGEILDELQEDVTMAMNLCAALDVKLRAIQKKISTGEEVEAFEASRTKKTRDILMVAKKGVRVKKVEVLRVVDNSV